MDEGGGQRSARLGPGGHAVRCRQGGAAHTSGVRRVLAWRGKTKEATCDERATSGPAGASGAHCLQSAVLIRGDAVRPRDAVDAAERAQLLALVNERCARVEAAAGRPRDARENARERGARAGGCGVDQKTAAPPIRSGERSGERTGCGVRRRRGGCWRSARRAWRPARRRPRVTRAGSRARRTPSRARSRPRRGRCTT